MASYIDHDEVIVETTPAATPVVATPVVAEPVVARPVTTVPVVAPATRVRDTWIRRFAPDAIVATVAGVILLLFGLVAITRGGFEDPLDEPKFEVLGFGHTTVLGLVEIGFGLALLIAGVTLSRSGAIFFGSALAIAGFVGAVQTESFRDSMALDSSFAWLMVLLGLLVVIAALALPRIYARTTAVSTVPRVY